MKTFVAKNPKQLDLCLKLMHVEDIPFRVVVTETAKLKIVYYIEATIDGKEAIDLERKYTILIS